MSERGEGGQKMKRLDPELIQFVQRLEIRAKKVVDSNFGGSYRSRFRGQGVQFSEHRTYLAGDDIRHIDWKASARSKDLLVKKYDEERELAVYLVVDVSGSQLFGTGKILKAQAIMQLAAIFGLSVIQNGDRFGGVFFSDSVKRLIPAKKGNKHFLQFLSYLSEEPFSSSGTNLLDALKSLRHLMVHKGIVLLLSDFVFPGFTEWTALDHAIRSVASRHELIAFQVYDPRETHFFDWGYLPIEDPETGKVFWLDSSSYASKKELQHELEQGKVRFDEIFKRSGLTLQRLPLGEDYVEDVVKFFTKR